MGSFVLGFVYFKSVLVLRAAFGFAFCHQWRAKNDASTIESGICFV